MGTKKGRIYNKGAPFKGAPQRFGGAVAPNCPPPSIRHWKHGYDSQDTKNTSKKALQ